MMDRGTAEICRILFQKQEKLMHLVGFITRKAVGYNKELQLRWIKESRKADNEPCPIQGTRRLAVSHSTRRSVRLIRNSTCSPYIEKKISSSLFTIVQIKSTGECAIFQVFGQLDINDVGYTRELKSKIQQGYYVYQQIGRTFKEEARKVLQLDHNFW